METIEEKINKMVRVRPQERQSKMGYNECMNIEYFATDCAIEQDRIARAEEREECVRAAQDWYKKQRNEPNNSQWYKQVLYTCEELRNFIYRRRGSCDSYVTDTLRKEVDRERERCINAVQKLQCKKCDRCDDYRQSDEYCADLMDIRKSIEEGVEV